MGQITLQAWYRICDERKQTDRSRALMEIWGSSSYQQRLNVEFDASMIGMVPSSCGAFLKSNILGVWRLVKEVYHIAS